MFWCGRANLAWKSGPNWPGNPGQSGLEILSWKSRPTRPGCPGQSDLEMLANKAWISGPIWPENLGKFGLEIWVPMALKSRPILQEIQVNPAWRSGPIWPGNLGHSGLGIRANMAWKIWPNLAWNSGQTSQYYTYMVYQGQYSPSRQVETDCLSNPAQIRPCDVITKSQSFVHPRLVLASVGASKYWCYQLLMLATVGVGNCCS